MHDVDFLPTQYKQQHLRRQSQPWQAAVVLAFLALLAGAGFAQHRHRRHVEAGLEAIEPQYQTAIEQQQRFAEVQKRLAEARSEAELLAYLQHPWPRTQLLAAVVAPLPDEITLEQIQVRRTATRRPPGERRSRGEAQEEEKRRAGLAPAARDLAELRDALKGVQTVVTLSGITRQSAPLHRYLGQLAEHPLIAKTELETIQNVMGAEEPTLQFEATLLIRPGYGRPGGPSAPDTGASPPAGEGPKPPSAGDVTEPEPSTGTPIETEPNDPASIGPKGGTP